jgi:hypothetical protein
MSETLKIAIIGDYNFTYNSHQATNLAIDHSGRFLEVDINYYWIKINEAAQYKLQNFEQFDGIWIAPGPFTNVFFLNGIIRAISSLSIPVLLTGESLRSFIEVLINSYQLKNSFPIIWSTEINLSEYRSYHIRKNLFNFMKIIALLN